MISKYFNTHLNETAVIIGNGPSLRHVPNMWLDKYPTFGSNKIFLKYTPTYYVCTNPLVLKQNRSVIELLDCEKFTRSGFIDSGNPLNINPVRQFSFRPHEWVYEGYTVTFVSLQLAFYFGFHTVLLVGVDHRYKYDGKPNEKHIMNGDDPNHFHPDYFKGQEWHNPDLFNSEISYTMAKIAYTEDKRKIINLTQDSELNVFEKDDIEKW